ncbi:MAG: response regulator [Cyanobacteria bacterium P01_C01_bin.89]
MKSSSNSLLYVAQLLIKLTQQSDTGVLTLSTGQKSWRFYFADGILNYAVDEHHRVRRWFRLVTRYNLNMGVLTNAPICYSPWEYVLLCRGIRDGQIRIDQAAQAIARVVQEVLFTAASEVKLAARWDGNKEARLSLSSTVTQVGLDLEGVQKVLKSVRDLLRSWSDIGLPFAHVNCGIGLTVAPGVASPKESTLLSLSALLNGTRSFWDVAQKLNQTPLAAARMLKHFDSRNVLSFEPLQNLPQPPELKVMQATSPVVGTGGVGKRAHGGMTIACIDDSPSVLNQMDRILAGMGCRSVGIREPIQALPTLLNAQPDLIFLDLIMPVVTGYELCAQIRRASALKDVPVVVLTSNDGAFDRVRANLAGATDFMSKPVDILRIVSVLKKYANYKNNIESSPKIQMENLKLNKAAQAFSKSSN